MFWKRTSLLPDNSCHWPKGGKARVRRVRKRGRERGREEGREERKEEGERERRMEKGGIQIRNDISLSASKCNHRLASLKWVSGVSLSLQSNLPSPTPTDVFDVKLIIK